MTMPDAPEKIWIQRPCRDPENEWFGQVTWSDVMENKDDTEYVRLDLAMAAIDRKGIILKEYEAVFLAMKRALIKHREQMFPGTDQAAVVDREFQTPDCHLQPGERCKWA